MGNCFNPCLLYTTIYNNYYIIILPFFMCFAFYQVCEFLTQRGVNSEIVEKFRVEKVSLLFRAQLFEG